MTNSRDDAVHCSACPKSTASVYGMCAEYLALRDEVGRLMTTDGEEDNQHDAVEAAISAILDQMSSLTGNIASNPSSTTQDLALKARVALDWIDQNDDIATRLVVSLCRDAAALYPSCR